jgi:hypothetical protein
VWAAFCYGQRDATALVCQVKKDKKNRGNVVDLRSLAKGKVNLLPFS